MTNPTDNNPTQTAAAANGADPDRSGETGSSLEGGQETPPEEIIVKKRIDNALCADGVQLDPNNDNLIVAEMAKIESSDDLKQSQISLIEYETGNAPLYRTLNRLLKLGELIIKSPDSLVDQALKNIKQLLTDEASAAKKDNRKNRGFRNIGVPRLPVITEDFIKSIRKETLEVFKLIVHFYYPNARSGPRARYYIVINFAHVNAIPNFVTWLAGQHVYTDNGVLKKGTGVTAAYEKAQFLARGTVPERKVKSDNELDKAFVTNVMYTTKKPDWLNVKDDKFFILARVKDDNLQIVNVTSSDTSQMKSAVKARYGSLFPSDFDMTDGDSLLKLREAIKNIIKYFGPSELVMWQEHNTMYLMPTNEQWKEDNNPNLIKSNLSLHYPVVLEAYPVLEKVGKEEGDTSGEERFTHVRFKEFTFLGPDEDEDYESDIFGVGLTIPLIFFWIQAERKGIIMLMRNLR